MKNKWYTRLKLTAILNQVIIFLISFIIDEIYDRLTSAWRKLVHNVIQKAAGCATIKIKMKKKGYTRNAQIYMQT